MTRRFAAILLSLVGAALAQYDDYPVGQFDFCVQRVVISPIKLMGGMDATKRDQGPKVDLKWTPNIDIQEARYEYILGVDGTWGIGPIGTLYLGFDSVKVNSFAVGAFARYYLGMASGPYAQLNFQWFHQSETQVWDGHAVDMTPAHKPITDAIVQVSGPQASPVLGYCAVFGQHLILEAQMGFTIGLYNITMPNGDVTAYIPKGAWYPYRTYHAGADFGGFYFAQLSLGVAW